MVLVQTVIGTKVKGAPAWLAPAPAAAYARMLAAGCPTGCITDAGRTYAEQKALYKAYLAGELAATAAYPGTSKHETGRALDLAEPARAWVRAHGAAYGWQRDRVKNEPWHMEHEAATDTSTNTPTEDDMPTPEEIWNHVITREGRSAPAWQWLADARLAAGDPHLEATSQAVWAFAFERSGTGPARAQDWLGDARLAAGAPSAVGTVVIDYAALAKAVNDDAARRLAD